MKTCISIAQVLGITILPNIFAFSVYANSDFSNNTDQSETRLTISYGYSRISVNEVVFKDSGDAYLSHLRWNAEAPIVSFAGQHIMTNGWTLSGSMTLNVKGNADMINRDWIDFDREGSFTPGSGSNEWTHQSKHSNSDLQHYIDLDLALGHNFKLNQATNINLHSGLKYNLVEMDAHGGNHVYSKNSFRDDYNSFQDSLPVINYKQWHRTVFAGAEIEHDQGNWEISGLFRAGLSIEPRDVDKHWLRDLRFDEKFDAASFTQIQLGAERKLKNGTSIFANANYQKYFEARGNAFVSEISTGLPVEYMKNAVGADLSATTFNIGIKREY